MSQPNNQRNDDQQQATTPPVVRLAAAEVDVVAAKDRLNDTVARLQSKLDPKLLATQATDEAKRVGEKGVNYARENQAVVGGIAGVLVLVLLRKPLRRLFRRRKYPKPQKAAKPMTATAPNERLAARPHPTQGAVSPQISTEAPLTPKAPLAPVHPTMTPAPASQSNEGAQLQGSIA